MILIFILIWFYSSLCAADMFLDIFDYRDTPEYAVAYLLFIILAGLTAIPILYRIYIKIKEH